MVVMKKNKNGFTLVELVVALLMVAFIASALFMFTQSMSRTHVSTTKTEASFTDAMNFADMLQASLAGANIESLGDDAITENIEDGSLTWTDERWVVGGSETRLIKTTATLSFDTNSSQLKLKEDRAIYTVDTTVGQSPKLKGKGSDTIVTRYPDVDNKTANPFRLTPAFTWKDWTDDNPDFGLKDAPIIRKGNVSIGTVSAVKYTICVPYVADADNGGGVEMRSIITAVVPTPKKHSPEGTGSTES